MCAASNREKLCLLIPVVVYGIIFILGMIGAISMGQVVEKYDFCPLYIDDNGEYPLDSNCNYVIAAHVVFCIICALVLLLLGLFAVYKLHTGVPLGILSSFLGLIAILVIHVIICLMILVAACVVSAGKDKTCATMEKHGARCSAFYKPVYKRMQMAEVASWLTWICWLVLSGFFGYRVWSARHDEASAGNTMGNTTEQGVPPPVY